MPSFTSDSKLLSDAEATLTRASQKELAGQLEIAYQLYLQSAQAFLDLVKKSTRLDVRNLAKAGGSRALKRADLIKSATKGDLKRVQRDPLSEEEQAHILKQSSRVNGITLPIWPAKQNLSDSLSELSLATPFVDRDGAPQLSTAHDAASAVWKRPPEDLPLVDLDNPDEIVQDVVSDCSVIAALGVCEEHRQRFGSCLVLRAIYPQDENGIPYRDAQGKYRVRVMFNGAWRMVLIDELLPTALDGRLICATTVRRAQLWPALLEKAYMKLMGGYDFPGSNSSIDLHTLTGWIPEHVYLTSNDFQREKSWKRIYEGFMNGKALVTLGTAEKVTGEARWKDILIPAHNYAIVGLEDDGAVQTLKILNPWRRTDSSGGGSMLTISWGLVCNLFESVYLNWDPAMFPYSTTIHGMWKERTAESGEHAASNHHYRLRYTNSTTWDHQDPPEIWALLTRHVLSKSTPGDFIALHHFAHVETGRLPRADQVPSKETYSDSPHVLIRIKNSTPNEILSLIASRDGNGPEVGYTLSVYSHEQLKLEFVTRVLGYIKTVNGTFTTKTAGGNPSLPTFMNNPQYRVSVGEGGVKDARSCKSGRIPIKLTVEGPRTIALNVKLVWSGGQRVSDVVAGDIVVDSGTYSFGFACVEGEIQAGNYTLVVSPFSAGQVGDYALRVECDSRIEISQLPAEGAGMFQKTVKGAWDNASAAGGPSSGNYDSNPAYEITVKEPTQISARLQITMKQAQSPSPALNLTLFERSVQGRAGKQVATSGAYSDAVSGVSISKTPVRPGTYLFVPSTYYPGVTAGFQMVVYSSSVIGVPVRVR
ncbi:calpain family cysteine protease [Ceratobasidium sp. AG-Ba]|nr:calpain family cysteine protease [Ceratobasidium sp. AG-Ba]